MSAVDTKYRQCMEFGQRPISIARNGLFRSGRNSTLASRQRLSYSFMQTKSLDASAALPSIVASFYANANAKLAMTLYFQKAVNGGLATWRINDAGQTEVHMINGEAFLLSDSTITKLR